MPYKELTPRFIYDNAVNAPIEDGIMPLKELYSRFKNCKFVIRAEEMLPLKEFERRRKNSNFFNALKDEGIVPVKELFRLAENSSV